MHVPSPPSKNTSPNTTPGTLAKRFTENTAFPPIITTAPTPTPDSAGAGKQASTPDGSPTFVVKQYGGGHAQSPRKSVTTISGRKLSSVPPHPHDRRQAGTTGRTTGELSLIASGTAAGAADSHRAVHGSRSPSWGMSETTKNEALLEITKFHTRRPSMVGTEMIQGVPLGAQPTAKLRLPLTSSSTVDNTPPKGKPKAAPVTPTDSNFNVSTPPAKSKVDPVAVTPPAPAPAVVAVGGIKTTYTNTNTSTKRKTLARQGVSVMPMDDKHPPVAAIALERPPDDPRPVTPNSAVGLILPNPPSIEQVVKPVANLRDMSLFETVGDEFTYRCSPVGLTLRTAKIIPSYLPPTPDMAEKSCTISFSNPPHPVQSALPPLPPERSWKTGHW
eukprot:TRINITY_DN53287_c0_g1_i1.p1 TRINITY_DN53287_c0_g1~~TRINITY_DN53287_c0_g1_i1.p1  ORF type:complete len:396 (-),score=26.39 TRINITY_DN53287_c0_g1_i1:54-1217(-)